MAVSLAELTQLIKDSAAAGQIPAAAAALHIKQAQERFFANPAEAAAAYASAPDVFTASPLAAQLAAREAAQPTPPPATGQWIGGQWVEDRSPGVPVPHPSGFLAAQAGRELGQAPLTDSAGITGQGVYGRSLQDRLTQSRLPAPTAAAPFLPGPAAREGTGQAAPLEYRIDQANGDVYVRVGDRWLRVPKGEMQIGTDPQTGQWTVTFEGKTFPATAGSPPTASQSPSPVRAPGPGTRGPGAGSSTFGMRLDPATGRESGDQAGSGAGRPPWWPEDVPYKAKRVRVGTRDILDAAGAKTGEDYAWEDQPDIDFLMHYQRESRLGAEKPVNQRSIDDVIADLLAQGNFQRARELRDFKNELTAGGQALENEKLRQQQLQTQMDELELRYRTETDARRRAQLEQSALWVQQQIRQSQQAMRIAEENMQRLRQKDIVEQLEIETESRVRAEEALRAREQGQRDVAAFPLTEQLRRERGLREQAGFQTEEERLAAGERRAQGRFGLEEQGQRFGQGLQERQFGLQQQGQRFGQALSTLGAGLDILRSPGDYYLYQTRLRDRQAPLAPYTGQDVAGRGAFLEPFSQQLASGVPNAGQQGLGGQAGQPFPGLAQALAGQSVSRPRQLPSIGAPPFLSLQDQARLLPSEREMRSAEVGALGIPLQDYEEQERRTYPRGFGPSPILIGARGRGGL